MKKIKFLAVALAAFTMFSCSNDEIENLGNNVPGEQAVLTINLKGDGDNQAQSRAAGAADESEEVKVDDYLIFLFRDGGALDCPVQNGTSASLTTTIAATTAAKKVYVVANTGTLAQGPFASVKTEADLLKVTGDLMTADNSASTQTAANLWMSGTDEVKFENSSDPTKGTATVKLSFVAAKIQLIVNDERKNKSGTAIQIQDQAVVLLYAGKSGKFFGEDRDTQNEYYAGDVSYFQSGTPAGVTLSDQVLSDGATGGFTNGTVFNHFYTFGNNGKIKPTILAIKSEKTVKGGGSSTIYYPIQFTKGDAKYTIEPGKSYTVTVTLNGDVEAGQGGGTTDPEAPVIKSDIVVTVTAAQWVTVPISKDFN